MKIQGNNRMVILHLNRNIIYSVAFILIEANMLFNYQFNFNGKLSGNLIIKTEIAKDKANQIINKLF